MEQATNNDSTEIIIKTPVEKATTKDVMKQKTDDSKKALTNFHKNLDAIEAKKTEVKAIIQKWGSIQEMDKDSSEYYDAVIEYTRVLRNERTAAENNRKALKAPIVDIISLWDAKNKELNQLIVDAETIAKPIKAKLDEAAEQVKLEKKRLAEAKLHGRINDLQILGAKLEGGYYVVRDLEGNVVHELQDVDINTLADTTWDAIKKVAQEIEEKKLAKKLEEEAAENARLAKIAEDEAKNKAEADKLKQDRIDMRKEFLEMIGFSEMQGEFFHSETKHKIGTEQFDSLDNDAWKSFLEAQKNRISELKADIQRKELTQIITNNNFHVIGQTATYNLDGFKHEVDLTNIKTKEQWHEAYKEFQEKKAYYIKLKEALAVKVAKVEADLINAGAIPIGSGDIKTFILKLTMPNHEAPNIKLVDALEMDESEFAKTISEFKQCIEQDKLDKINHDKNELAKAEVLKAENQSDDENISEYKKAIKAITDKLIFKNKERENKFRTEVLNFLSRV